MHLAASVIIPTRNRCELLRDSIRAAQAQSVPVEIIVLDDGSTDATPEMMRQEFPQIRYERFDGHPRGPSFLRNRGSAFARAPILFPIDDDAVMASPLTVEQTLAEFDHPRVAAVGVPFINVQSDAVLRQCAPGGGGPIYVTDAYVGASHAVRRDVFLALGGYREALFYMGEESDLGIRMLADGYVVRAGAADPIHHHESPHRSFVRMDYYARRNDILFAWHHVPWRWLGVHLAANTFNSLRFAARSKAPMRMIAGLAAGYIYGLLHWEGRRPVPWSVYRLYRQLRKSGPQPLSAVEPLLPAPRNFPATPPCQP